MLRPRQRLDLRQFDPSQPQSPGDSPQQFALAPVNAAGGDRRLHLDFHEGPLQIRPVLQLAAQPTHSGIQRVARCLAGREVFHGAGDLGRRQLHAVHDQPRSANLGFRHPAVGLGDMTHDGERRAEKRRLDVLRREAGRLGALGALRKAPVELVPDQDAHRRAHVAAGHQSQHAAHGLADPDHSATVYAPAAGVRGIVLKCC